MTPKSLHVAAVANNIKRGDGQGRVTLEIIKALLRRGHKVTAYSITCEDELIGMAGFSWRRIWIPKLPDIIAIVLFAKMATRALNRDHFDAVLTMGPCAFPKGPTAYYVPFTQVGWKASWEQSGKPDHLRRLQAGVASRLESKAVPRVDLLLPTSVDIALQLRELIDPRCMVRVIPGGASLDDFPLIDKDRRQRARKRFGFQEEDFVMVMVGEYATGRKGLDRIVKAMAARDDPREKLLVKGAGPAAQTMLRLANVGMAERVKLVDPADGDVGEAFAAADAAVVLSLYEPFSLVVIEAAASGLPVIASSSVGAADYIGEAALKVDPFDVEGIRRAIELLKGDASLRARLGVIARQHAEVWTWEHISEMAAVSIEEMATTR